MSYPAERKNVDSKCNRRERASGTGSGLLTLWKNWGERELWDCRANGSEQSRPPSVLTISQPG